MIDFFYKWYSSAHKISFFKLDAINRHVSEFCANFVLPVYFKRSKPESSVFSYDYKNRHRNVIASVTTYPARIDKVWLSIESIFRQTVVPDVVVLWLSKEQFPDINNLPPKLQALQSKGLKIELREGDLRSHKKYYYALKEYPNYDLFTFDDDIIYPSNALETVLKAALEHSNTCICRYSNQIRIGDDNFIYWSRTLKEDVMAPSYTTFCGSGGGTLYPYGSLPEIALAPEVFMKICKTADDVWLNSMLRFKKTPIMAITSYCPLLSIRFNNNTTLSDVNIGDENRRQFSAVREYCIGHGFDIFKLIQ